MTTPVFRPRRLRQNALVREMVRETRLSVGGLVLPLFISAQVRGRQAVPSMPGVFETDLDELCRDAESALTVGVNKLLLFGVPKQKNAKGSDAYSKNGIVQKGLQTLRKQFGGELLLMADTCLCQYTDHGHCGILTGKGVDNDATLDLLGKIAVTQAAAGADVIAPSGMIDGMIARLRTALDGCGLQDAMLMSYAVKYASALYGPFRDVAHSTPSTGDRRGQQMDPANTDEALREAALDEGEGADILMVKPALSYLDIIHRLSGANALPVAAYLVSGEYAMVKAAAANGWVDEAQVSYEHHLSIRRAGARIIITYAARDIAAWMKEGRVGG